MYPQDSKNLLKHEECDAIFFSASVKQLCFSLLAAVFIAGEVVSTLGPPPSKPFLRPYGRSLAMVLASGGRVRREAISIFPKFNMEPVTGTRKV